MTSTEERRSTCTHDTRQDKRSQDTQVCSTQECAHEPHLFVVCTLFTENLSRGIAVHGRGLQRPGGRPASRLTCTYSGSRLTALLMAHTLNCTSVSSAVALLLNLQDT